MQFCIDVNSCVLPAYNLASVLENLSDE